jgi:steroid delta-isomerase-like uncharacterized protein
MSRNIETAKAEHRAFNQGDLSFPGGAEDMVYVDHARGLTVRGKAEVAALLRGWKTAMSNAQVTDATYIDAGDTVIAQFVGRGVQDGPMGPFPPSGKAATLPYCEIMKFNARGEIQHITAYYDQLGLLAALGHVPAP